MQDKYKVITLCGSTRFKDEFIKAQKELTLQGNIVISLGLFKHSGDNNICDNKTIEMLADMQKRKIDMSDEIFVINKDDYIGKSTKLEINYALNHGINVNYLEKSVYSLIGEKVKYVYEDKTGEIVDINFFEEDTFGQGKYIIKTSNNDWLYPREFQVLK